MSRKRSNRRARPLWNPLVVARNQATALTPAELAQVMVPLRTAFEQLRRGLASDSDWCVLAGSVGMAGNIEKQGVVRGLSEHLAAADRTLVAIEARATQAGPWRSPTLYFSEIDALHTFVDLHEFQLKQLSYGEFRRAYLTTEGQVRSRGGAVVRLSSMEVAHAT